MDDATRDKIQGTIDGNRVVLFMKGSKNFPQCGFSAQVVEILRRSGTEFQDVNVLTDPSVRDGIKEFSNWPTIPQLYVEGQFVGGCDIVTDLYQSGELDKLLGKAAS
jgi:monothiol glutaredoxin